MILCREGLGLTGGQMQVQRTPRVRAKPQYVGDTGLGLWSEVMAAEATTGGRGLSAQPTPARRRAGKEPLSSPAPGHHTPAVQEAAGLTDKREWSCTKSNPSENTKRMPAFSLCPPSTNILKRSEFLIISEFVEPPHQNQE